MEEHEIVKKDLEELKEKKEFIENNRDEYIANKLKTIEEGIKNTKNREPEKEGNISMNTHLKNKKQEIQNNPDGFIDSKLSKLDKSIKSHKKTLEELEGDN